MVNITDVEISRDLTVGKIYVTFVDDRDQKQIDQGIEALNGASGYLRKLLANSIKLRIVPRLTFYYDESGRRGQHLSALIDLAISKESPGNSEEN